MATFIYKGKDKQGHPVIETIEASDRFAVYDVARKSEHTVDQVDEVHSFAPLRSLKLRGLSLFLNRITLDDLVMLTRNLSAMLKAGLALSRALSVAERQSKNPRLKATLHALGERLNAGSSFHEALAEFPNEFSRLYVAMVHAGEEGGKLTEALATLALQMERTSTLKKKIKGAMVYPVVVISVMFLIGVLMMVYVIPTLTATFRELNVALPLSTQVIIFISDALAHHTALTFGTLIGFVVVLVGAFRTRAGHRVFDWMLIHMPIIGTITKEVNAARTTRTLSSLLSSGVDVVGAITITNDVVQNSFYHEVLKEAALRVEKGETLSSSFVERDDLYPLLVGEMIAVGEETGQISPMLQEIAVFYEAEIEQKTKDLSTIIEPLLMVVIGGLVGFFAMAMISPIYSISDSIG